MKFMQTEKKQLLIYVIIAYGITYVMGLLMWYGYGKGLDLSAFPNAQMLYPAAGVMTVSYTHLNTGRPSGKCGRPWQ